MTGAALLAGFFQLAYVTNDLEAATERFRDSYGTGDFLLMRDLPDPVSLALAHAGDTVIELMESEPGASGLHSDWIVGTRGLAVLHCHHCFPIDEDSDWMAMRTRHVERADPIPMKGQMPGAFDYLYAGTTADLGQYLKYVPLYEEGRQIFGSVLGSPFASASPTN